MLQLSAQLPTHIEWLQNEKIYKALWRNAGGVTAPKRVQCVDDTITADAAFQLASEGTALLWQGDFQNARQLLQAIARRIDHPSSNVKKAKNKSKIAGEVNPKTRFNAYRLAQSQRSRTLGKLMVVLEADYTIRLKRAPDWQIACTEAYGAYESHSGQVSVVSLRELLGIVGAHEWRKNGVFVPQLSSVGVGYDRIHPHYGVFAPVRNEYLSLISQQPLPALSLGKSNQALVAFDIGTGTGVIAAILAKRGVGRVIATDINPNAICCATENIQRLNCSQSVQILKVDMFPPLKLYGKADLIVCNPPWLPARPNSVLEQAVYDLDSRMLVAFLNGLVQHLQPQGEAWLILSNLSEHLGLRSRDTLLSWIVSAGLTVLGKNDIQPVHAKAADENDDLYFARSQEVTSLWRLGIAQHISI